MEPPESSGDSKTPEAKSKRKHGTRSSSTTPDRMDAMENKIDDLTSQLRQLTTALTSLTTSPSLATSSPTPSSPSSSAFGRTLGVTPTRPLAAGRSAQQPLSAQNFFTAKPERAIDKEYRLRRDAWIAANPLNDDQRELLRNIASRKPENVTF